MEKQEGLTWVNAGYYSTEQSSHTIALGAGTYRYSIAFDINRQTTDGNVYMDFFANVFYHTIKKGQYYKRYLVGGGLRIKEIRFLENENTTELEMRLRYFYNEPYETDSNGNSTMLPELEPTGGTNIFLDPNGLPIVSSGAVDGRSGNYYCKSYQLSDQAFLRNVTGDNSPGSCNIVNLTYTVRTTQQNNQLTKGGYVGYKHVRVREAGKGYSHYTYKTPQDEQPLGWSPCVYPFKDFPNIDHLRGWLLTSKVFDEQKQLLKEEINTYEVREENIATTRPLATVPCAWIKGYTNYDAYMQGYAPNLGDCSTGHTGPKNCGGVGPYSFISQTLKAGSAPLKSKTSKEYFINDGVSVMTQTRTDYEYNPVNYQVSSETQTIEEGDEVITYKTDYEYPVGGYTASLFDTAEQNVISEMGTALNNKHVINKPIVTTTYKNGQPLHKTINKYKITQGLPVIKEIETLKGDATTGTDRIIYHQYDSDGNPLEVSMADGTHICYIWGYNKTFPAAKLEGFNYNDIPNTLKNDIINATAPANFSEATLVAAQDALRAHYAQAGNTVMITTLVYESGRGVVTSVTDPRGDVLRYEYDNLGRLLQVRDKDNHILSKNQYHYRTEQ